MVSCTVSRTADGFVQGYSESCTEASCPNIVLSCLTERWLKKLSKESLITYWTLAVCYQVFFLYKMFFLFVYKALRLFIRSDEVHDGVSKLDSFILVISLFIYRAVIGWCVSYSTAHYSFHLNRFETDHKPTWSLFANHWVMMGVQIHNAVFISSLDLAKLFYIYIYIYILLFSTDFA